MKTASYDAPDRSIKVGVTSTAGVLSGQSGAKAITLSKSATGTYTLTFLGLRAMRVVTVSLIAAVGFVQTQIQASGTVNVWTYNSAGTLTDQSFSLMGEGIAL